MELEEAVEMRRRLEGMFGRMVSAFSQDTGLKVSGIGLTRLEGLASGGARMVVAYQVELQVDL